MLVDINNFFTFYFLFLFFSFFRRLLTNTKPAFPRRHFSKVKNSEYKQSATIMTFSAYFKRNPPL